MKLGNLIFALAAGAAATAPAAEQSRTGPMKEIVIGTIQDLSGPLAPFGKTTRNGILLWADEINEQGGIHGRKVRVVVDDHGYDPKKAVLAAQKQASSDKVFLSLGNMATPTALAAMPVFFEANIPHLFPITAARQMYEPLHRLKYAFMSTYFDQIRSVVRYVDKAKPGRKWCVMYQDDDFGQEVLQGTEAALKALGKTLVDKTSYKRGATDFSSQMQKLQSSGCDSVALGTILRETVGAMSAARKLNWSPQFVGSVAAYNHLIPQLGGALANGLISGNTVAHPYLDDASPKLRFWANKYKTRFNEDPDVYSAYGYSIGNMTGAALAKAGPNLTTDTFIKALESLTWTDEVFGGDQATFTAKKHLGTNKSRMSEVRDGRWVAISEYMEP